MSTTPQEPLKDEDIETTGSRTARPTRADADGADGKDAGGDGDATEAPTGLDRRGDADGTDGGGRRRHRRLSVSALDLLSGDAQTFLAKIWASRVARPPHRPGRLVGCCPSTTSTTC